VKTVLMNVTPAQARKWLKFNTKNRKLRPGFVEELHMAHGRGEWKTTHQGIAFARNGQLLDGQHRLTFISQLAEGLSVPVNVTTDCDEGIFDAIDLHQRRTLSDITGVSEELGAVGRFFARIYNSSHSSGLTPQFVRPFIEWAEPEFVELISFSPAKVAIFSSASVRAAAIYMMKLGHDSDFVKVSYDSLVRADIDSMPYGAKALMQQRMSGKIMSARTLDLFCRAVRAFDSTRTGKIRSILVIDASKTIQEVRDFLQAVGEKSPDNAGQKVAKPSGNSNGLRG
jgi:hypothetical protein